jgi:sRNA-binding carbon storage regulator CsrA
MLIITRKETQEILVTVPPSDTETQIVLQQCKISGNRSKLGFEADSSVKIVRTELKDENDVVIKDKLKKSHRKPTK